MDVIEASPGIPVRTGLMKASYDAFVRGGRRSRTIQITNSARNPRGQYYAQYHVGPVVEALREGRTRWRNLIHRRVDRKLQQFAARRGR